MSVSATRAGNVGVADPERHPHNFYRTQSYAVDALFVALERSGFPICGKVVDPCCGDGAIMDALAKHGIHVTGADLHDRGRGVVGLNYMDPHWFERTGFQRPDWVVMNPPYGDGLPVLMLDRALGMASKGVAALVRAGFIPPIGERDMPCQRWDFLEDPRMFLEVHVGRMRFLPPGRDKGKNGLADFVWLVFRQDKTTPGFVRMHFKRLIGENNGGELQ